MAEEAWIYIPLHCSEESVRLLSCSRHKTVFASFGDGAKAFAALISRGENDERVGVRGGEGVDRAVLRKIQLETGKKMKQ